MEKITGGEDIEDGEGDDNDVGLEV